MKKHLFIMILGLIHIILMLIVYSVLLGPLFMTLQTNNPYWLLFYFPLIPIIIYVIGLSANERIEEKERSCK